MSKRKSLIISALLGIILLFLIICIKLERINNIDNFIYSAIANLINEKNTTIFKFITFFGSSTFIILLVLFFLFYFKKSRRGIEIATIVIISTLINNIIKIIVQRPRPEILPLVIENSYSFPSGHTMAVTTLSGILIYLLWQGSLNKKWKTLLSIFLIIFPILIMISRIYLGVHFFSDVLGGYITSIIIILLFVAFLDNKFQIKK